MLISANSTLREWAHECIGDIGHLVTVPSALDALRGLEVVAVQGVIFDVDVGDMRADRFYRWVRRQLGQDHPPVLFLSGPLTEAPPEEVLARMHRVDWARRPFECSDIRQKLETLLGSLSVTVSADLTAGGLALDRTAFVVSGEKGTVTLTATEFHLLEYLMEKPGVIIGADELLEKVWGFEPGAGRRDVVRAHMANLRAKIAGVTERQEVIRTLPGRGYQFAV